MNPGKCFNTGNHIICSLIAVDHLRDAKWEFSLY